MMYIYKKEMPLRMPELLNTFPLEVFLMQMLQFLHHFIMYLFVHVQFALVLFALDYL